MKGERLFFSRILMKNTKQLLMILFLFFAFLVGCGNNSTRDIVEETTKISTEAKPAIKSFERELKVKGENNDQEILDIFTKAMQALSERDIGATVQYTNIDYDNGNRNRTYF